MVMEKLGDDNNDDNDYKDHNEVDMCRRQRRKRQQRQHHSTDESMLVMSPTCVCITSVREDLAVIILVPWSKSVY